MFVFVCVKVFVLGVSGVPSLAREMGWDGKGWDGTGWDGINVYGMGWDGSGLILEFVSS